MNPNPKYVQIPYETYRDMITLIFALDEIPLDPNILEIKKRLEKNIYAKMDAAKRREEYTQNLKNKNPQA